MNDDVTSGPLTPSAPHSPRRGGPGLAGLALAVGIAALTASAFLLGVFVGAGRETHRVAPIERMRIAAESNQLAALASVTPVPSTHTLAQAPVARPAPTSGTASRSVSKSAPAPAPAQTPRATPAPTPAATPTPAVVTASATAPVRLGGMQLRLLEVQVGPTPLQEKMFGEQLYTPETNLNIRVELTNTSSTWKTDYTTWVDETGARPPAATLRDNFGNSYHPILFKTSKPLGKTAAAGLYPGQSVNDLLVFEHPIPAVRSLTLELPAANFGREGLLRLQIPVSMIKGLR